jgi:predicted dinucleotide-binding enzyme
MLSFIQLPLEAIMGVTRRSANHLLLTLALGAVAPVKGKDMKAMRIGVIGAGSLGGTVGSLWVKAGHEVMFSSRHPEELAAMAKALGSRASTGTPQQAAAFGSIILVATPYQALGEIGRDLAAELRGKVVLDACNPSAALHESMARELGTNNVGEMTRKLLPGVRLVRAFSAVDATSAEASFNRGSSRLGVPLASDDTEALRIAAQLTRDAGCEPVIVGNLSSSSKFQRGTPAFRANTNAEALKLALGE